jgi:hypothetical protein
MSEAIIDAADTLPETTTFVPLKVKLEDPAAALLPSLYIT